MVVGLTVAPRVGAWIEIPHFLAIAATIAGRAPRGRVD